MDQAIQEFLGKLPEVCGWTTQAKLTWLIMGALVGICFSVIVGFIFKNRGGKNE